MTEQQLLERITLNSEVMAGKPVIRGTRLTVEYILSPLQKVRTLPTQCRALKRLEGQKLPSQRPNRPNERKPEGIRWLFHPPWLPPLPYFLLSFRLRWPYPGPPEAMQPPDIDHRRRPNHHTGHAKAAPHRGFPARKGMLHTAHRGFYCRPQVPPPFPMLAGATPPFRSLQRFAREAQDPLSRPFPLDHRATTPLGTGGTIWPKDRHKCLSRRGCPHLGRLPLRADDLLRLARCIRLDLEILQVEPIRVLRPAPNRRLDQGDRMLRQQGIIFGTPITAVGEDRVHPGAIFQVGEGLGQQGAVVRGVRRHLRLGDQLHRVLGVAGLGQVDHVAAMALPPFFPIGRFQVIRRLQTASTQFAGLLDLESFRLQTEMLGEYPRQDVIGGLIAVGRFQFCQQVARLLTDALQVDGQVFFLQPIDVLPGVPLQIGGEEIGIALLVLFREHPPDPLQNGHQQLHPSHLADVGSQQGAIHPLLARLEGERLQLFLSDLLKGLAVVPQ